MAEPGRDPNATRDLVVFYTAVFLACLVGVVWATTTIAATFFGRPIDGQVHVIMLAVVTGLLGTAGLSTWKKGGNGA